MTISIDWSTRVIFVPKSSLTHLSGALYELDINEFRQALKDHEDNVDGMVNPDTHKHNTSVLLDGVTYARIIEIINGYTVTFEDGQYAVKLIGANSNISSVTNINQVSIRTANSAGLIEVETESGGSCDENDIHGALDSYANKDDWKADVSNIDLSSVPEDVWNYAIRTLTSEIGMTPEQEAKLDKLLIDVSSIPTKVLDEVV